MWTGHAYDRVQPMIQLKSFADDGWVAVEVTLPEAVMQHHDRQRLLSLWGVGGTEIAAEQGRNTESGKRLADSKEGDGVLRNVVAGDIQMA